MEEEHNIVFFFWLTCLSNNQFNVYFKIAFSVQPESPSGTEPAWAVQCFHRL